MLRKLVAVTSAAVVAVGLAAAPAVASDVPELSVANRGHGAQPPPLVETPPDTSPPAVPPPDVPESPPPEGPGLPPEESGPAGPPGDSGAPPSGAMPPAPPPEALPPPVAPGPPPPAPPDTVAPAEHFRSPAGLPEETPQLPQTGTGSQPLTVTGGVSLLGAGLAVIAGARRRQRQVAGPTGLGRRRS